MVGSRPTVSAGGMTLLDSHSGGSSTGCSGAGDHEKREFLPDFDDNGLSARIHEEGRVGPRGGVILMQCLWRYICKDANRWATDHSS